MKRIFEKSDSDGILNMIIRNDATKFILNLL